MSSRQIDSGGSRQAPIGRCSSPLKVSPSKKNISQRKNDIDISKEALLLDSKPVIIDPSELKAIKVDIRRNISPNTHTPSPLQHDIGDPESVVLYRKKGEGSRPLFANIIVNTGVITTENPERRRVWTDTSQHDQVSLRKSSPKQRRSRSLSPDRLKDPKSKQQFPPLKIQFNANSKTDEKSVKLSRKLSPVASGSGLTRRNSVRDYRKRSPSYSPSKRSSPYRRSSPRRRSPRRSPTGRPSSPKRSPRRSPYRRSSPRRHSPRHGSPSRSSQNRHRSPGRSPNRHYSPGKHGSPSRHSRRYSPYSRRGYSPEHSRSSRPRSKERDRHYNRERYRSRNGSRSPHRSHSDSRAIVHRRSIPMIPDPGFEAYYDMGMSHDTAGVWVPRVPIAMVPRGFRPPPGYIPRMPFMQPMRFPHPNFMPNMPPNIPPNIPRPNTTIRAIRPRGYPPT